MKMSPEFFTGNGIARVSKEENDEKRGYFYYLPDL